MVIPSPLALWNDPVEKVRGFGKFLSLVLAVVGLWVAIGSRTCGSLNALAPRCPFAAAWAAGESYWLAALLVLIVSILAPAVIRPGYVLLSFVGMCIGFVLGHAILIVTYLTLFVIIGRLRRATSPVTMGFDPSLATYWTGHGPAKSLDRYYRQY